MKDLGELGIAMAGLRSVMAEALDQSMLAGYPFVYVELGVAEGRTLYAVADYLGQFTKELFCVGVDIEDGWSLDLEAIDAKRDNENVMVELCGSEEFLKSVDDDSINFLFIDACHSKACTINDFLLGEDKVKPGGIIMIHDSDVECQGLDVQPHCNVPIQVREAVIELGLLNGRDGWRLVADVQENKELLSRGCVIVQKK